MEKLSPKESVEGADTLLRGSVRAPKGFSKGLPKENPEGALTLTRRHPRHSPEGTVIPLCPNDCQQSLGLPKS